MKKLTKEQIKENYPNAVICEGAIIGDGARIREGAIIYEGAIICEGAIIYEGAIICEGAIIGEGARIREGAEICEGAIIGEGAKICEDAIIGEGARIEKGGEGVVLHNSYKYSAGWYYDSKINKCIIRLGCFHRTIEDWEKDFDNNINEFPIDSPEWKKRKFTYEFLKNSYEFTKNLK